MARVREDDEDGLEEWLQAFRSMSEDANEKEERAWHNSGRRSKYRVDDFEDGFHENAIRSWEDASDTMEWPDENC